MDNRIVYAFITFFFNSIGIPCFLQGKAKAGTLRIVYGLLSLGIVSFVNSIMGIILAIKIFGMTDEEFAAQKATLLSGIPSGLNE